MHFTVLKKILNKYASWERSYKAKMAYGTTSRIPFFEVACEAIPKNKNSVVIDVGAGDGRFAKLVAERLDIKPVLLDANANTICQLSKDFCNVLLYEAPEPLPFKSASVDFIHCSHLVEHLTPPQLYSLLCEFDRVLKEYGLVCISAPLLWRNFYYDLSHIRPYYPEVIVRYMCSSQSRNYTRALIKGRYNVIRLVYRYDIRDFDLDEGIGSRHKFIDIVIQVFKKMLSVGSICHFSRNGYTLILRKIGEE